MPLASEFYAYSEIRCQSCAGSGRRPTRAKAGKCGAHRGTFYPRCLDCDGKGEITVRRRLSDRKEPR